MHIFKLNDILLHSLVQAPKYRNIFMKNIPVSLEICYFEPNMYFKLYVNVRFGALLFFLKTVHRIYKPKA